MTNGAVVVIHPRSPGAADVCGLQAGGKSESEVDVRPLVLTMGDCRTDNRRSPDPLVHPRRRDEAFAKIAPLPLAEHRLIVGSATSSRRPGHVPPGDLYGRSGSPLNVVAQSQSADASLEPRKQAVSPSWRFRAILMTLHACVPQGKHLLVTPGLQPSASARPKRRRRSPSRKRVMALIRSLDTVTTRTPVQRAVGPSGSSR